MTAVLEAPTPTTSMWTARPVLAHIEQAARARLASPDAVLAVTLVRALSTVPPHITLPPLVGGRASLNTFVALVAGSGGGKGVATSVSTDAVFVGDNVPRRPLGSGEGMAKAIAHREHVDTPDGPKEWITVIDEPSVIFEASEVDQLGALTGRTGATLMPQLRSAWSGEQLGATYADATKAVILSAHDYRLGLIVGVQPRRSGALLDDTDGGTPQRFVWALATDPDARDGIDWPGTLTMPRIEWPLAPTSMRVPRPVAREIRANRIAVLKGNGDALDGHALLARLKVAAALAVLDGRPEVTIDDWHLSALVMHGSDRARALCVAELRAVQTEEAERRGEIRAHAEHAQATVAARLAAPERIANNLGVRLDNGNVWTRGDLARVQASRDRPFVDEALAILVREGRAVRISHTEYRSADA